MWEEDENDLAVFVFYTKLPIKNRIESEIFITPEKIYHIKQSTDLDIDNLFNKLIDFRNMDVSIIHSFLTDGKWQDYTIFKRIVSAIKEYYALRPEVIENFPEFLI